MFEKAISLAPKLMFERTKALSKIEQETINEGGVWIKNRSINYFICFLRVQLKMLALESIIIRFQYYTPL